VERVLAVPPPRLRAGDEARCTRRIVLVDDGSTDGSRNIVKELADLPGVAAVFHVSNRGKGAAIRSGFAAAQGMNADAVLIHDADLEYDPADHEAILRPILDGRADAVIGSRFIGGTHRVLYYWHSVANRIITTLCNMATNLNLTDIECCTKAFRREVAGAIQIEEDRFGVEVELVAKVARMRVPTQATESAAATTRPLRVYEVAVTYAGRTYAEGKKITWKDGVHALVCIARYGVLRR